MNETIRDATIKISARYMILARLLKEDRDDVNEYMRIIGRLEDQELGFNMCYAKKYYIDYLELWVNQIVN